MEKFDAIVIGAGSGGLNVASFLNRVGLSVLLVERDEASIGGDCLNFGCVPSKALIHVSRLVAEGKEAEQFGFTQNGEVDFECVKSYIRGRQGVIREHENAEHFRTKGMTVVLGEASFGGKDTVVVNGIMYRGKRIIIATGSRPRTLTIRGMEHVPVYTNETIFNAIVLPKNLVVLGGGPIGFEIGQAFQRLGSSVTVVNRDEHWLAKEHRRVVEPLMKRMEAEGVKFISSAEIAEITETHEAVIKTTGSRTERVHIDALFLSVGRIADFSALSLTHAGIAQNDRGGLMLDPYLRTTNKRVFAVGDAAGLHQFTHAAEVHAALIIRNFFLPRLFWKKLNTEAMAWVTYTDPEIATFGMNEEMLAERNIPFEVVEQTFAENDRSITDDRTEGFLQWYVSRDGKLLGGTVVGKDVGEYVGELILAMTNGLSVSQIFSRVYPYPTTSRIYKRAAGEYLGKKLTKRLVWILGLMPFLGC